MGSATISTSLSRILLSDSDFFVKHEIKTQCTKVTTQASGLKTIWIIPSCFNLNTFIIIVWEYIFIRSMTADTTSDTIYGFPEGKIALLATCKF